MLIARRPKPEDDGFVRLHNLRVALLNLLGVDPNNQELTEAELLALVKARLEDRNMRNDY